MGITRDYPHGIQDCLTGLLIQFLVQQDGLINTYDEGREKPRVRKRYTLQQQMMEEGRRRTLFLVTGGAPFLLTLARSVRPISLIVQAERPTVTTTCIILMIRLGAYIGRP